MKLYELAFACHIYSQMTDYDSSYLHFLQATSPELDLTQSRHRTELLEWLNQWGCRQFAKAYYDLAGDQIKQWYEQSSELLPPPGKPLHDLSGAELESSCVAYGRLIDRIASRHNRDARQVTVRVGPTGASKILFALRPDSLPPWDEAIRIHFSLDGSPAAYRRYLRRLRAHIADLAAACKRNGHSLDELPKLVGRPDSTLVKLLDEYHWVVVTRGCQPPPTATLAQWAIWEWRRRKAQKRVTPTPERPQPASIRAQQPAADQSTPIGPHTPPAGSQVSARLRDVQRFYEILARIETKVGGKRALGEADGRMDWPERGVYFVFEPGEERTTSGSGLRVVRVGTHGLKARSRSTLWGRLRTHRGVVRGQNEGGGNHRGSVFRLHVGTALIRRDDWPDSVAGQWGVGQSAEKALRDRECPLEQAVSEHIRGMSVLWVGVDDTPGPESLRGYIERNSIALLSNHNHQDGPIDPPSNAWLGGWAANDGIGHSGLWNINHTTEEYDPKFLEVLEQHA